jgi:hypothetical protein
LHCASGAIVSQKWGRTCPLLDGDIIYDDIIDGDIIDGDIIDGDIIDGDIIDGDIIDGDIIDLAVLDVPSIFRVLNSFTSYVYQFDFSFCQLSLFHQPI